MDGQHCPICRGRVPINPRYPRYLCSACAARALAPDGRPLRFYNIDLSGGFQAFYADTDAPYPSHACQVDGIACRADEARFGGIVIERAD
ncbi:hypothetical protein [Sphingomonas sp.]|uniref:hypothetical protein n=1 Tax=Sphingomonas sp. TaxID=28214 RepID=UPI0028A8BD54|nr:hypothetical protein [Sphingomonas sp.]